MSTWVEIGYATPPEWIVWLYRNVGERGYDWMWNDDSCGHYFLCFHRPEDALAFKLRFEIEL